MHGLSLKQFTRTSEGTKAGCIEGEVVTWGTKDARRKTFYCVPFLFQVLRHLHMLTIQNEFLKTKPLHKIQQRKDRKENVREGQKPKGKKEDLRRTGKRKAGKGKHLPVITALLLQNYPGLKSAFLSILPTKPGSSSSPHPFLVVDNHRQMSFHL